MSTLVGTGPAALRGKDDWLFLTGDKNSSVAYSTGTLELGDEVVRGWQRLLEFRSAWLAERGIAFYFFVVPNKEVVYADRLPESCGTISEERPARRIERRMAAGSSAHFDYLLEPLLAGRDVDDVYPRIDTHWNGWGAFVSYLRMMEVISAGSGAHPVLTRDDITVKAFDMAGDLGSKLDPPVTDAFTHTRVLQPRSRETFDNGVVNNGRVRRWEWYQQANGPTVMFFHDSFFDWLLHLVAESFPRTVAAHNFRMDCDLIERERPDIVVAQLTERFLRVVPDDATGLTTDEFVALKTSGRLERNEADFTAGRPPHSG